MKKIHRQGIRKHTNPKKSTTTVSMPQTQIHTMTKKQFALKFNNLGNIII